jgi:hypothetical protein
VTTVRLHLVTVAVTVAVAVAVVVMVIEVVTCYPHVLLTSPTPS